MSTENASTQDNGDVAAADARKDEGNAHYKAQRYDDAVQCYTEAITLTKSKEKQSVYFGNRAQAYMMQNDFRNALSDCETAIALDPSNLKCYLRAGKCHQKLGDLASARSRFSEVHYRDPMNEEARAGKSTLERLEMQMTRASEVMQATPERALALSESVLTEAPLCRRAILLKAQALFNMKKFSEVSLLLSNVIQEDRTCVEALVLRGVALFKTNNVKLAISHLTTAIQLDPENTYAAGFLKKTKLQESLKNDGNTHYSAGRYNEAIRAYSDALALDPDCISINSVLYANRAQAYSKIGNNEAALSDLDSALSLDPNYLKAYLRRAAVHTELEHFQDAVYDLEKAKQMDPSSRDIAQKLHEAKIALKKASRKDYYKILEIPKTATDEDIRKAYRKLAVKWHPDKHQDNKKEAEAHFKDIGEAYHVLSDQQEKARYDSGVDLDEPQNVDTDQIFRMFFGGDNPLGGGFGRSSFGDGGFPGGFSFSFGGSPQFSSRRGGGGNPFGGFGF
ncbi:DnaJ subfamily C protein [Pelomyxa schiedti]|nr:DnaJ subfamily C protein [Pelomyxa schiedti]